MDKPFDRRPCRARTVAAALAFVTTLLIAAGIDGLARQPPDDTLALASAARRG